MYKRSNTKNFKRKVTTSGGVISRVKKVIPPEMIATKQFVKNAIAKDIETKYRDLSTAAQPYLVALGNTTIINLCDIPQSAGNSTDITRIGDEITLKSIDMRCSMLVSAADVSNSVRMIIFQWLPNITMSGLPLGSRVISDTTVIPWLSNYVNDYQNQFIVLYDKIHTLVYPASNAQKNWRMRVPLRYAKKKLKYTGGSSTDGSNLIFVLLVSDSAAATHPSVFMQSRVHFDDA